MLPQNSNKIIDTRRERDKSKSIIEGIQTIDTKYKSKIITPKNAKKTDNKLQHQCINFSRMENYSLKKKIFPSLSLYVSKNKKSNVQARINMNNYETNINKPILLSSSEKTT